jgi:phage tail-like protein
LIVTGQRGLLRFATADFLPEGVEQAQGTLITPMLQSPDREDRRRWLRVEASAQLPEGSTLVISYAATDDTRVRDRLNAIAADRSLSMSRRINQLLSESDLWRGRTEFYGSDPQPKDPPPFMAKLFDVSERYLWVAVTLTAAAGAGLPVLSQLAILYPGRTLMESLPAIYQREEARPESFLRGLVGVLEATTQELDTRIALIGSLVHPSTAPEPWLNFIARWLGVPWDDRLNVKLKRAIVMRAADLARGRGTRAGLEALLESLMPGVPRRFRVTDATADFGFAMVGAKAWAGSALPAMLGGHTRWSPELDSGAVLGHMRLPCDGLLDDSALQLVGRLRIDVAATATERKAWEPWLLTMITEMVPLTARVELRWVSAHAFRTNRLDGTLTLEAAPTPHLGTDAVTGLARLPDRGTRTSASGPSLSTRLR